MHPMPMHVRLGYSRSPPPWGLRKELAFVLCLISQGLPSTPSEMSFTVQMASQLGDVWGRNSSDPTAGACGVSVHPPLSLSQSCVLLLLPTLGIIRGRGMITAFLVSPLCFIFERFHCFVFMGPPLPQITPALCGRELPGVCSKAGHCGEGVQHLVCSCPHQWISHLQRSDLGFVCLSVFHSFPYQVTLSFPFLNTWTVFHPNCFSTPVFSCCRL